MECRKSKLLCPSERALPREALPQRKDHAATKKDHARTRNYEDAPVSGGPS
jgi:hypothetical protein